MNRMIRTMITLFLWIALTLNGQNMANVDAGTATLPRVMLPVALALFPPCPTEDSDWCVWDARRGNGLGDSFLSLDGYGVIFR